MPVSEWRSRSGEEFGLTKTGTTTAVPADDKYSAELRGHFAFNLQLTLMTELGPDVRVLPDEMFRCDIANYVAGSRCVFTNSIGPSVQEGTGRSRRRSIASPLPYYYGVAYTQNGTKQCHEHPFATTYENSVRVNTHTVYDYAVRAIDKDHNEAAGRAYGTWLSADHILDYDPFWVQIVP